MRALRIALLLVVAAEVFLLLLALVSPKNTLPADSDLPREQHVSGWPKAAELARTDTFEPTYVPGGARPELTVRGVPGDSSRPLAAEYGNGLLVRQAHVDVDPQLEDESAVMVARSRSAVGPFEKQADATGEFGGSVILQQNDRWEGTGHNSVVRDEAGRDWIFYHAMDPGDRYNPGTEAPKRPMLMDPIVYRSGWPEIEEQSPSTEERQGPLVR